MFVRCAYYIGSVKLEDQELFDSYIREVHLPDVANWPLLRGLRLLKNNGQPYEGEVPRIYQCFELSFDTQADMDACMASEERQETRRIAKGDIDRFKGLFPGEVVHVNFEVTEFVRRKA